MRPNIARLLEEDLQSEAPREGENPVIAPNEANTIKNNIFAFARAAQFYGTGFGSTNPPVVTGPANTTNPVTLHIHNITVTPSFAGISGARLYQMNLTVPSGLGTASGNGLGRADAPGRRDLLAVAGLRSR